MGKLAGRFRRFPLLLKFLDAREMLSVQVHPADNRTDLLPAGETGKTEAWVVLEAGPKSRIYAGLRPGVTEAGLRQAITNGGVADQLAYITPQPGDAVFIPAGTVHSLGGDIVVFEVQENSDVTFRLYDWNHVDAKTGKPRAAPGGSGACLRRLWEVCGRPGDARGGSHDARGTRVALSLRTLLAVAPARRHAVYGRRRDVPSVLVCIAGTGQFEHGGATYAVGKGDVFLLPAVIGPCTFRPCGTVSVLEIEIPQ